MVAAALLLAVQVVRNAAVAQFAELLPARAAQVWPDHPQPQLTIGLTESPSPPASANRSHLRPSPGSPTRRARCRSRPSRFWSAGSRRRSMATGRWRCRRSAPPSCATGGRLPRVISLPICISAPAMRGRAWREIAVLSRIVPNGVSSLAPYVAAYSKSPRNWPALKALFRSDPALENASLSALATDPANADLVLALGNVRIRPPGATWQDRLIASLVTAQQYGKARSIWAQTAGSGPVSRNLRSDVHRFQGAAALQLGTDLLHRWPCRAAERPARDLLRPGGWTARHPTAAAGARRLSSHNAADGGQATPVRLPGR